MVVLKFYKTFQVNYFRLNSHKNDFSICREVLIGYLILFYKLFLLMK